MDFEELVAFTANLTQVPDPIARKAYRQINQRTQDKHSNPAEIILQKKMMFRHLIHDEPYANLL